MSRRARRLVAAVALLAQMAVLYLPGAPVAPVTALPMDKVVHAAVFALATCTLIWAEVPRGLVIAGMLTQAVASELIQGAVLANRSGEVADVIADGIGIAIGLALVRWRPRPAPGRSGDPNRPAAPA